MAGVLLTGFEPFDGETVNPSWEVVKQLDGTMIAGQPVIARQLPCVFGGALSVPKKNLGEPLMAACTSARRCFSRLSTGRQ